MQQIGKSEKKLFQSFFECYPQPKLNEEDKLLQNLDYAKQQIDKLLNGEIFSAFPKFYQIKQILSKFVDFVLHQYLHSDEGDQIAQQCQNAKVMVKKIKRNIQKIESKDSIDCINDKYLISPSKSLNKIFVFDLQSKEIVKDINFQYKFNDGYASLLPVKNSCYIASDSSRSNKFIQLFVNETKQLQNMPVARSHTSLCLFDSNTIYCTGGYNSSNAGVNVAHFYEIDKGKWTQVSAMNSVKYGNSTIGFKNFVFTFGGSSSNKYIERLNHLEYDKPWTVLNVQNNPITTQTCKGFSRDNKIIVFYSTNMARFSVGDDGDIIFDNVFLNKDPSGYFQQFNCPLIVWNDQVILSSQNLISSFNINGLLQQ